MAYSPSQVLADDDDELNLPLAETSASEECATSYSDLIFSSGTSSIDTLEDGWGVDATIDPALLTQGYGWNAISAYDAPMQQP